MKKGSRKNRIYFRFVLPFLALLALSCFAAVFFISRSLASQHQAGRWQGESEREFAQISCYIPVHEKLGMDGVYNFRKDAMERLHSASLDIGNDDVLYVDAWSCTGKVSAASALGSGEAAVYAVGGEFFSFHPIRLLSGSYLSEDDLMKDRVLLDEDLAWLLFGGTDLEGMSFQINGLPFYVAGVVARDEDRESGIAYGAGMGLFMSYDAYKALDENANISCYEFVMAEPVEGFALSFAKEKFPLKNAVILDNGRRFEAGRLYSLIKSFGRRSMQTEGVIYPYWENAARFAEDWCALLLFVGTAAAVVPTVTVLVLIIRLVRKGKRRVSDELIPKARDNAREAIRKRQRRRWEKRRGLHEKK